MGIDELTFSPDGQYLASSGFHYAPVSIWCAKTGTHVASFTVEKPQKGPRGKFPLCFSPDGNLLAYVSSQNLLAISRIDNEHTILPTSPYLNYWHTVSPFPLAGVILPPARDSPKFMYGMFRKEHREWHRLNTVGIG